MKSTLGKLYRGETNYDFIAKRRLWFAISGVVLLISLIGLGGRQLNLGIDFTGGAVFDVETGSPDIDAAGEAVGRAGTTAASVQQIGDSRVRVQTEELTTTQVDRVRAELAKEFGVTVDKVTTSTVGAKWGEQVTNRALRGLVVFLLLVIAYISLRFEWKMAAAAIIALIHDLIITVGIYALVGFEVTPSTVIAYLTILGYSLYDTVVVYDKLQENTVGLAGGSKMSYSQATNLSINQTIMRSLNTTLTSLIPIGALLFVGAGLLGAGTLKDLSLALFIGIAAGSYSSIFLCGPIVAWLKEQEPQFKALAARVQARSGGGGPRTAPRVATATAGTTGGGAEAAVAADAPTRAPTPARSGGARPARPGQKKRKGGRGGRPSGKKRR